ncbi:MAG: glutamate synthase [Planctomycetota bacterium]|jgi:putative selenate reductase|nr:glutamate synthase [Planctomycetota bacterium]MDP6762338.1 glutamate synthase [Planctomycetota bacterium]MDP6989737.1 glutamate synthase [Planctomycetota bacterium]
MAELRPLPFGVLVRRMFAELERDDAVFHLPRRRFVTGTDGLDVSVRFHGHRPSTPFGPAAGPQSQLAQNLVLSWLGGARVLELKTVQVDDAIEVPRPCIDMRTIGFNAEWSQELTLEQSLEEYVKGAMLIELLREAGGIGLEPGMDRTVLDMSVGYDLAGLKSEKVTAFLDGMADCAPLIDRLRREIPTEHARLRDVAFPTRLADTLTLSTFHGCPPQEIEAMVDHLLREHDLDCIVKLNPTLAGRERVTELLHEVLGYTHLSVPPGAFARDTTWEQMCAFTERLGEAAAGLGRGFGVKFTNTLIVANQGDFLSPAASEVYLSGAPLHVLAMDLVGAFRRRFGDRFPISFSAGIDRRNFPAAVSLGLVPVTACSDLLKPGGYARAHGYFALLAERMRAAGARTVDGFVLRAHGLGHRALGDLRLGEDDRRLCAAAIDGDDDDLAALPEHLRTALCGAAALRNTEHYLAGLAGDPRYRHAATDKPPRKVGSDLDLFDCLACDKCVPVCPNDANFRFELAPTEVEVTTLRREDGAWVVTSGGTLAVEKARQYASFADFCNECGNCDAFCPEDGGPYLVKPRFFGSLADWRAFAHLDGFHLAGETLHGRFAGVEVCLAPDGDRSLFSGEGFALRLDEADPLAAPEGSAEGAVDLTYFHLLRWVRDALLGGDRLAYPALLAQSE